MQHDMVEAFVRERQSHAIALHKVHLKVSYAGFYPFQHGRGEIKAGISMSGRKMREIEAGTNTTDQDVLSTLLWQLREACSAQPAACGLEQGIVKRGDDRIGTAQGHKFYAVVLTPVSFP